MIRRTFPLILACGGKVTTIVVVVVAAIIITKNAQFCIDEITDSCSLTIGLPLVSVVNIHNLPQLPTKPGTTYQEA